MRKVATCLFVLSILIASYSFGMPTDTRHQNEELTNDLNRTYDELFKTVEKKSRVKAEELKKAEQAWIQFRERECSFAQLFENPKSEDEPGCTSIHIRRRIEELQKYLDLYKSDVVIGK